MEQGEQISVMMETNELDPNSFHNEMFHNIKEILEKKLFCDVTLFGKDETSEKTEDDVKGNHVLKGFGRTIVLISRFYKLLEVGKLTKHFFLLKMYIRVTG
jgi:hypothetical protein